LVVEIKDKDLNPNSNFDYENNKRRHIIDEKPIAIVATTTIQPKEPKDPEEGEHLFHPEMWVKGPRCILLLIVETKRTSS
jgi:hypothetical protein